MGKGKLAKFAELRQMPHVFQNFKWQTVALENQGTVVDYKGKWASNYFGNNHPIILELACGYGEYTMAIAEQCPNKNVIGIDMKGNRIWTGATYTLQNSLTNAAFIRTDITLLQHIFAPNEVSEIWLTFPDPQRQKGKARKRLTATRFLDIYRQILQPQALIHLKTDSDLLYEYTLEVLESVPHVIHANFKDVYAQPLNNPLLNVKTRYEKLNLSGADSIKYLRFSLH